MACEVKPGRRKVQPSSSEPVSRQDQNPGRTRSEQQRGFVPYYCDYQAFPSSGERERDVSRAWGREADNRVASWQSPTAERDFCARGRLFHVGRGPLFPSLELP